MVCSFVFLGVKKVILSFYKFTYVFFLLQIAKDAKECVQECVSEFISFITSEASERCHQEKRKTINGEDILFAMSTLGFDSYVEPLKLYLQKFREVSAVLRTVGVTVHSGFRICRLKCFAAKYVTFPVAFAVLN